MKQNLTKILLKPVIKEEIKDEEVEDENKEIGDVEYEELFSNMETITDNKEKASKRKASLKTSGKKKKKISLNT